MKETTLPTLTEKYRSKLVNLYRSKYFNLFCSKYKWKGLNKEQEYYLMLQLWDTGTVAAFNKGGIAEEDIDGVLTFANWVRTAHNEYNRPTKARILNPYNATGFPKKDVTFGIDAVYMYAMKDMKPISEIVDTYISMIVDVEMIIKTHEYIQKMPLLIKSSPENEAKLKEFMRKVWRNEPTIYVTELEANAVDVLSTGAPFILDKLYQYRDQREAELKTFLGMDNSTKMENTIIPNADMVNANNQEINSSGDVFLTPMEGFAEEITEVLHQTVSVELTQKPVTSIHDEEPKGDDDNVDD